MNKKSALIALAVIILVGLGIWGIKASKNTSMTQETAGSAISNFDGVSSFTIEKPNFIIKGKNLSKVEVWAVPTGTNISESDVKSVGVPTLQGTDNGVQTWTLPIPKDPILATDMYVIGFDKDNKPVGSVSLGVTGATAIYDAVWGKGSTPTPTGTGTQTSTSNPLRTLKVGDAATFGDLMLTLKSVDSDSRCPQGVNCIQAGSVAATIEVRAGRNLSVKKIDSAKPLSYNSYTISVDSITPAPVQGEKDLATYQITFRIKKD